MGTPLKNPPVYFTVTQVRFNTILKLADYLPAIQEGLRKHGYPAFTTHRTIALQITVGESQVAPQPVLHEQFLFTNLEQTHCFVLSADTLTFQSTNYGTYEMFSEAFMKGLGIVHSMVTLDFTERVGLRYLDHVFPGAGNTLEQYLAPEVQGLGGRLGGQPVHSYTEAFNTINNVKLRARVLIQDGGLAFPPDLLPQGMVVQERFVRTQGKHAMLDTDGFVEERHIFSLDTVGSHLKSIHKVIGNAFHATVTTHAQKVWDEQ